MSSIDRSVVRTTLVVLVAAGCVPDGTLRQSQETAGTPGTEPSGNSGTAAKGVVTTGGAAGRGGGAAGKSAGGSMAGRAANAGCGASAACDDAGPDASGSVAAGDTLGGSPSGGFQTGGRTDMGGTGGANGTTSTGGTMAAGGVTVTGGAGGAAGTTAAGTAGSGGATCGTNAPTVALFHFDGPNGSTNLVDSSGTAKAAVIHGGPAIGTAQSKFGGSSLYVNGDSSARTNFVVVDGGNDFDLPGDFTVDFWYYAVSFTDAFGALVTILDPPDATSGRYGVVFAWNASGARLHFTYYPSSVLDAPSPSLNAWHHLAATRSGTTYRVFVDGKKLYENTNSVERLYGLLNIANPNSAADNGDFNGFIDELRVVKGAAVWTTDFVPPTEPYVAQRTCAPDGGYVTNGAWSGYAWTSGSGASVNPTDFTQHAPGTAFCGNGSVEPGSTNWAALGFNINHPPGGSAGTWTPASLTVGGVIINVTNPGGSELRVQVQAPGANRGYGWWCAQLRTFDQLVLIPWTAFNTECWSGGAGSPYAGEALENVTVNVPGASATTTPFDFCVNSLGVEGDGTKSPGAASGTGGAAGIGGTTSVSGGTSPVGGANSTSGVASTSGGTTSAAGGAASTGSGGGTGGGSDVSTGCGSDTPGRYFCDDFESGLSKWLVSGQDWNTTTTTWRSAGRAVTDSPTGDYPAGVDASLTLAASIDLASATAPVLSFWYKLSLSTDIYYDHAYIEASSDGGVTWSTLAKWYYSSNTTTWALGQVGLSAYVDKMVKVRFRLYDFPGGPQADGWYIDDVAIQEAN